MELTESEAKILQRLFFGDRIHLALQPNRNARFKGTSETLMLEDVDRLIALKLISEYNRHITGVSYVISEKGFDAIQ